MTDISNITLGLNILFYSFIQQIVKELLCSRHDAKHWGQKDEVDTVSSLKLLTSCESERHEQIPLTCSVLDCMPEGWPPGSDPRKFQERSEKNETEKKKKLKQDVLMSRLLLWAAGAQAPWGLVRPRAEAVSVSSHWAWESGNRPVTPTFWPALTSGWAHVRP